MGLFASDMARTVFWIPIYCQRGECKLVGRISRKPKQGPGGKPGAQKRGKGLPRPSGPPFPSFLGTWLSPWPSLDSLAVHHTALWKSAVKVYQPGRGSQGSPEMFRKAQGGPGRPRKAQGGPWRAWQAQESPGKPRKAQRGLGKPREALEGPGSSWDSQGAPGSRKESLGVPGSPWDSMGLSAIPWDSLPWAQGGAGRRRKALEEAQEGQ